MPEPFHQDVGALLPCLGSQRQHQASFLPLAFSPFVLGRTFIRVFHNLFWHHTYYTFRPFSPIATIASVFYVEEQDQFDLAREVLQFNDSPFAQSNLEFMFTTTLIEVNTGMDTRS